MIFLVLTFNFQKLNYENYRKNCITHFTCFCTNFGKLNKQLLIPKFQIMQNSLIRNEKQYQSLIEIGYSKEKAAQVANMSDDNKKVERVKPYDEWTKEELYQLAIKKGIPGRSYMNKRSLIKSLRSN